MCTGCVVEGSELCASCHARLYYDPATRHLRPLAIVMMVHGGLMVLGGLFAAVYGVAMAGAVRCARCRIRFPPPRTRRG